jgi:hypothetical protein
MTFGCATTTPLDAEIALARHGEDVLASMDDLEAARVASTARLARLEELVRAAPARADVRRMLVIGWARHGLLFVEDDVDEARERGDGPTAGYHAMRARNAYERALHHGRELLGPAGFDVAASNDTMGGWLAGRVGDDPEVLAWMGAAWLGRIRVSPEERKQLVLQAHVGEALLERSVALDPRAASGWAHVLLGLWRGRAGGDLDRARQHFERASEVSGHKLLLSSVFLARTVVCQTHDRERWDALFKEVLDARDPAPELRIDNAVAKRKASRDLAGTRRAQCVP